MSLGFGVRTNFLGNVNFGILKSGLCCAGGGAGGGNMPVLGRGQRAKCENGFFMVWDFHFPCRCKLFEKTE